MSEIVITTVPANIVEINTQLNEVVVTQNVPNQVVIETQSAPDIIEVVAVGPQGPQGIQGIQGPQGVPGAAGDKNFLFTQSVSSAFWVVAHNLNKFPAVTVVDTAGTEGYGTVNHVDVNNLTIKFSAPFSGKATCN